MSELDDLKAAFKAHKTETQKRWDELTRVQNFSYEKYRQIMAAAQLVPGLQAELQAAAHREAELKRQVEVYEAEIGRLKAAAENLSGEVKAANAQRNVLNDQLSKTRDDIANLRASADTLEQRLAMVEAAKSADAA